MLKTPNSYFHPFPHICNSLKLLLCSPEFHHCAASSHCESNTPGQQQLSNRCKWISNQKPSNQTQTHVSLPHFQKQHQKHTAECSRTTCFSLGHMHWHVAPQQSCDCGVENVCSPLCSWHSSALLKALAQLLLCLSPHPPLHECSSCPFPKILTQQSSHGTLQGLLFLCTHFQEECRTASST